ncbi:hypothetical protein N0V84_000876 [Fusarium piperis]|uniref:Uncharacterized protein n=1 Tax=Fusarium piperis TaxID=1435070 RepID=A0A9W9BTV9_9HYPO|nr:hypothetical protein N0V84_000876 [Fusarium piperis]
MHTDEGDSNLHTDIRARHKPITTIDWRAELCRVLEQPIDSLDEHILDYLESSLDELRERRRLELLTDNTQPASPRYQVLYRIECGDSSLVTSEKPPWVVEAGPQSAHLRVSNPISNLELYLERNKDIAFLVYADLECCSYDPKEPLNRQVEFFPMEADAVSLLKQESVVLVSEYMEVALCELAESALEGIPHPTFELSEEADIVFPYLWWYYRRDTINEAISQLDEQSQLYLSVLQRYISERLAREWNEVDDLIFQRRITQKYLHYIFVCFSTSVGPWSIADNVA